MRTLLILIFAFVLASKCNGQSDFLMLKKKDKTVKSFYPGTQMKFYTSDKYHEGVVTSIERDSIFLLYYDVRQVMTTLGIYVLDTVATYPFAVDYRNITAFKKERNNFDWSSSGAVLFGGGVLLATAGLISWIFTKPNTEYYVSPHFVTAAAVIAVAGYFIMKSAGRDTKLGKKYTLRYIKLK